MFEGLGITHILIFTLILVLLFGAKRIPEIGSSIGHGIREFKRSLREVTDDPAPPKGVEPPAATPSSLSSSGDPKRLNQ